MAHWAVGNKVFETKREAMQYSKDGYLRDICLGFWSQTQTPVTHFYLGDLMAEPIDDYFGLIAEYKKGGVNVKKERRKKTMKRKTMEVCGETFNIVKNGERPHFSRHNYYTVYDAYGKPSEAKKAIWEYWREWALRVWRNADDVSMWVSSRNTNVFTLTGYIEMNDKTYGFYITKTRQEIWECD